MCVKWHDMFNKKDKTKLKMGQFGMILQHCGSVWQIKYCGLKK